MGEGSSNSSKQCTNFVQDCEGQFTIEEVKVKKMTANAALTAQVKQVVFLNQCLK